MRDAPGYHQIGGFRPQIHWSVTNKIEKDFSPLQPIKDHGQNSIELILGIKASGTSHLLITDEQAYVIQRVHGGQPPSKGRSVALSDFESLSPIYFNQDQLKSKLRSLTPKSSSKWDNSQTNKAFFDMSDNGKRRAAFENARLLYLFLHNRVDPVKFSIFDSSWAPSLRFISFVFNIFPQDERPRQERLESPKVLDLGLSEVTVPDFQLKPESSIHITLRNNERLSAGSAKLDFRYGTTELLWIHEMNSRLTDFFRKQTRQLGPTILLVHNRNLSLNALKYYGVNTSSWYYGLKDLLHSHPYNNFRSFHSPRFGIRPENPKSSDYDYSRRRDRHRSRSRSPRRKEDTKDTKAFVRSRNDVPLDSGHTLHEDDAQVYVVDTQEMFMALMQTGTAAGSVAEVAKFLGLPVDEGWCAGNESALILDVWKSMVCGLAIDEQRAERESIRTRMAQNGVAKSEPTTGGDCDSDQDPNDLVQQGTEYSDDDSDYGESD